MKHSVSEISLKNGAKGLVVHVPGAQVTNIEISFRAGEYLVDEKKWEVPHLMEHMLLGANEKFSKARLFQAEIEKNGAYTNASTGTYYITYEAECADFEWQRVTELLLVAISKPLFLESEFKSEFGNVREELIGRANDHYLALGSAMRQATGFKVRTDKERLKLMRNVELADIRAHYERTHGTNNMRFVVGGNFTPERMKQLEAMLETINLPRGRRFALPVEKLKKLSAPLQIRNRSVTNLYIYIDTFLRRRMDDPEVDALNLANTLLTETLYSKILGTAREQGLIYGMGSGMSMPKGSTNWWFGTQVSLDNASALVEIIVSEIGKLLRGEIDSEDVEAAKNYQLGRYQRTAQTINAIVSGYSERYYFDGTIDDYYRVPQRIRAVTQTAIVEAARAMFSQGLWAFGALGNAPKDTVDRLYTQLSELWGE